MELHKMMAGIYAANCYIYYDPDTKDAIVVDPGGDVEDIYGFIEEKDLNPKAILLTHGHADHIAGVGGLIEKVRVPVYVHEADEEMCREPEINLSSHMMMGSLSVSPDYVFKDGDILDFGTLKIKVVHTPGHTKGSCSFYTSLGLITGDTLFKLGIGRSDLYGGNESELFNSIRTKLYSYPDDTNFYPGHGGNSTIGFEKKNNPFVR